MKSNKKIGLVFLFFIFITIILTPISQASPTIEKYSVIVDEYNESATINWKYTTMNHTRVSMLYNESYYSTELLQIEENDTIKWQVSYDYGPYNTWKLKIKETVTWPYYNYRNYYFTVYKNPWIDYQA